MNQFALVTSFYTSSPEEELNNNLSIAAKNLDNPFIEKVLVLLEGQRDELEKKSDKFLLLKIKRFENEGRLELRMIEHRPMFLSIFEAGRNLGFEYYLIANSDIFIDQKLAESLCNDKTIQEQNIVLALTRWNITPSGMFIQTNRGVPPWLEIPVDELNYFVRNYLSFDAYYLNRNTELPILLSRIPIGSLGCDTAIAGLFRINGSKVFNPCLSYRIKHEDNKMRNHTNSSSLGQQEIASFVIRDALLDRFQLQEKSLEAILNLEKLQYTTASIGRSYNKRGCWFNIFRIVGSCPWQQSNGYLPCKFRRLQVNAHEMVEKAEEILMIVVSAVSSNEFIEIQISGGYINEHRFLDLFVGAHPYLEIAREILHSYDWQSVIFLDYTNHEEQQLHDKALYMLAEILGGQSSVNNRDPLKAQDTGSQDVIETTSWINLVSKSLRINKGKIEISDFLSNKLPFLFRGMVVSDAQIEKNGGVTLKAPHDKYWFALIYDGIFLPGDNIEAHLNITTNAQCTLFVMLCREGFTQFEAEYQKTSLIPGVHSIKLHLLCKLAHSGIRIQVGSMDGVVEITNIESSIQIKRGTETLLITETCFNIHEQVFKNTTQAGNRKALTASDGERKHSNSYIPRWLINLIIPSAKKKLIR